MIGAVVNSQAGEMSNCVSRRYGSGERGASRCVHARGQVLQTQRKLCGAIDAVAPVCGRHGTRA